MLKEWGNRYMQIAIDGPVGSGKSTISRELAKRLGIVYVDTGALYRAVGLYCKNNGVSVDDESGVRELIGDGLKLEIKLINGTQRVFANGNDVSGLIRSPEVSMLASDVSRLPYVRRFLLDIQRDIAKNNSVVMDGRDIGTVILPDADVKIYLTANDTARARRRYDELAEKGQDIDFNDVLADLKKRDFNDMNRETAPLKQAEDAILIDSTLLTFKQTADKIYGIITAFMASSY
ncbi:MAG: (d)CMP kinase [Eubacterium sp.]|jgi:cytidylate kinase|nr:(d)CMP kinase [Eubacterium sp.]